MCGYNRYMVELRWASVRDAQSDINEDLHAAELKYTVLNVFNNGFNYSSMFIRINVQYNIIQ